MKRKFIFAFIFILLIFSTSVLGASTSNLGISSPSALLIEASTDTIIYEKNSNVKMYPASTTKILTALLTLEKGNLTDVVTVSSEAVDELEGGYVTMYISKGEKLTVEQLLNILLVPSGNVAGNILAEYVSGSMGSFVDLMNTRAKELGCTNSHFTNTYGKHDDNHYTTAHDLYLITKAAMKYDIFREIVSKTSYVLEPTNRHSKNDRTLYSTNDLLKPTSSSYYEYAIGIKTGYTSQAKDCLVSAATKDNMTLYAIMLGSEKNSSGVSYRYIDTKKLYDFGFKNYLFRTVKSKNAVVDTVEVPGGTSATKKLNVVIDNTISALISSEDIYTSFIPTISINKISAPISQGQVVGSISYTINDKIYTANLIAETAVEKSYMFIVVDIVIVLAILVLIRFAFTPKKRKKSKKSSKNYRNKSGLL